MRVQHGSGMFKQNSGYHASPTFSPLIWLCLLATKWDKPSIPDAPINKHEYEETGPFWKLHDGRWDVYITHHSIASLFIPIFLFLSFSMTLFTHYLLVLPAFDLLFLSQYLYLHLAHLVAPPFFEHIIVFSFAQFLSLSICQVGSLTSRERW